ncbi:MAG: hypothetical protein COX82_04570, partial [Candidatus Magasanikbacteria bacterium CG_4_10_14_0_2_um_filter_41_10]
MLARIKDYNQIFFRTLLKLFPKGRKKFFVLPVIAVIAIMGILGVATPARAILSEGLNVLFVGFSWIMFTLARLCIGITIFALKFFIEIASYNNFIDTPTVKIGWFLVRDVANMFFVIVLLVIAFGTILGLEQYEWKKTLGKLIFAAIFINFSNMIAQLIIDVAHVFTITFVNAISATAGGNIIRLFNIDAVYKITGADKLEAFASDLKVEAFAASVAAFLLALIMMVTMGAFAIVMAARMVILWVLIILSPLAYIFQVIPQTQKYAQEWWSEFMNHVIVAPIMVFFLWLAFATLNTSIPQLDFSSGASEATAVIENGATVKDSQRKLSISDATTWENLASFIIATVFLLIGLKTVRNLGVVAGGMVSSATGFAKNVATIATGVAFGRGAFNVGKSAAMKPFSLAKQGAGAAIRKMPIIGTDKIKRGLKNQWEGAKAWAFNTGYTAKVEEYTDEETGETRKRFARDENNKIIMEQHDRGLAQRFVHFFVQKDIAAEKKLEKTTNFASNRKELLDKRTTGIPKYWLMKDYEKGIDALDRVEQGMLEGEKKRSGAKTGQFKLEGEEAVLHSYRYKDGELRDGKKDKTVAQQIAKNKLNETRAQTMIESEQNAELKAQYEKNPDLVAWINAAEMMSKGAQDAIKEIKNLDLQAKFKDAGDVLKKLIADGGLKSAEEVKKKISEAFKKGSTLSKDGIKNAYIASLAQAQTAQVSEESKTTRERQASDAAHDAFVHMPRYGTTSASSVLSDLAEVKLKQNYSGLDRAAAMQQATSVLMKLRAEKKGLKDGEELDIDKQVEMYAASAYLQSEAWNDDQAGHIYDKFEGVQQKMIDGKKLDDDDKAVLSFAEDAAKLGWIQSEEGEDVLNGDGTLNEANFKKADLKKSKKYGRSKAADMQNLAITGGDLELLRANKVIVDEMEKNKVALGAKTEGAIKEKKEALRNSDVQVIEKRGEAGQKVAKEAFEEARTKALSEGKSKKEAFKIAQAHVDSTEVQEQIEAAAEDAMMGMEEVQNALIDVAEKIADEAKKSGKLDYWKLADELLPKKGIKGLGGAEDMRKRYEGHGDFMQHATINNKKWALANGHSQLGYNQNYDESRGVYRLQSVSEASESMNAERVKIAARKLINTDQKHSMGDLDINTGIIDDFEE